MSLILRTQLTRPLTHEELDNNLKFIQVKPWDYNDYKFNQLVFQKYGQNNTVIYRCVIAHQRYVYDSVGGDFATSVMIDGGNTIIWEAITDPGGTIRDFELDGTVVTIGTPDVDFTIDLNNLLLAGAQFETGITTHDFVRLGDTDFAEIAFDVAFPGPATPDGEMIQVKSLSFAELSAKETTLCVSVSSISGQHLILKLPGVADPLAEVRAGTRVRCFVKRNDISDTTKKLMIGTTLGDGHNRILCPGIQTKIHNMGHFLPLETMETVDLFWDGQDWIALGKNNLQYVAFDSLGIEGDNADFITRTVSR